MPRRSSPRARRSGGPYPPAFGDEAEARATLERPQERKSGQRVEKRALHAGAEADGDENQRRRHVVDDERGGGDEGCDDGEIVEAGGGLQMKSGRPSGYVTIRFGISVPDWFENFSELVESRIGDREAAYSALSRKVSGWGALAYACGLPALLLWLARDDRFRRLAIAFPISLASVLLLVQHDDWFARFVLFFPAVLVLAVALVAARERALLLVAVPALLLQFVSTMVPEELPAAKVRLLAGQPWRQRSTAEIYDAYTDGVDALGYYADNYSDAYLLYRSDFSRRLAYVHAMTPAGLADELKQADVDMVYTVPGTIARQQGINDAVREGHLRRVRGRFYAVPRSD